MRVPQLEIFNEFKSLSHSRLLNDFNAMQCNNMMMTTTSNIENWSHAFQKLIALRSEMMIIRFTISRSLSLSMQVSPFFILRFLLASNVHAMRNYFMHSFKVVHLMFAKSSHFKLFFFSVCRCVLFK